MGPFHWQFHTRNGSSVMFQGSMTLQTSEMHGPKERFAAIDDA